MPFTIVRNDLASMHVDAIVVAANSSLAITGGVGAAVAEKAGFEEMQAACSSIGYCPIGHAVATPGFALPARVVVHAVGPKWHGGQFGESDMLAQTYRNALACATASGARSVALPLISSGAYGFPSTLALSIANAAIGAFIQDHDDIEVTLVLYNRSAMRASLSLYDEIAEYIDDRYVEEHLPRQSRPYWEVEELSEPQGMPTPSNDLPGSGYAASYPPMPASRISYDSAAPFPDEEQRLPRSAPTPAAAPSPATAPPPERGKRKRRRGLLDQFLGDAGERTATVGTTSIADESTTSDEAFAPIAGGSIGALSPEAPSSPATLEQMLDQLDAPFTTTLLALIDSRALTDAEVYKRANMSRQLFSKIRSDAHYRPTKKTVLALAIALQLDLTETNDLLRRAGFALSSSSKADVIVEYFIVNKRFDIIEVNEALYAFDQPLL